MGVTQKTPDVFDKLAGSPVVRRALVDAARAARRVASGELDAHEGGQASAPERENASAMTHSWVFTGPPGSGRSTAALAFACALVCRTPGVTGCGTCKDCRAVLADTHGDVVHLVPHELTISVATIRGVIREAAKLPTTAPWRVVIIENADRLSESAANALLKTVEEPPKQTVIILCAPSLDPRDLAITLRSRCRHLYIPTPPNDEVARLLVEDGDGAVSEADAKLAAAASAGHIGRARILVKSEASQRRRAQVLNLAELVYHGDVAFREVTSLVKAIEQEAQETLAPRDEAELEKLRNALGMGAKGKGAQKALRGTAGEIKSLEDQQKRRRTRFLRDAIDLSLVDLSGLYRDALLTRSKALGDGGVSAIHPDFSGLSGELAAQNDEAALVGCIDAITHCRETLGQNVRPVVALDALVGRLRQACNAS